MRFFLFCIAFLCSSAVLYAQSETPILDSLHNALKKLPDDTNKVNTLLEIAYEYTSTNPTKTPEYGEKAIKLSQKLKYTIGEAKGHSYIGVAHINQSQYFEAIQHLDKALAIGSKLNKPIIQVPFLVNKGNVYNHQGNYEKALELYLEALKASETAGNKSYIAYCLGNIGTIYEVQNNFDKALEYHQKALQIDKELGDDFGISYDLSNIALVYLDKKDYAQAEKIVLEAISLKEKIGDAYGAGTSYTVLADIYYKQNFFQKSADVALKILDIANQIDDARLKANGLQALATSKLELGETNKAITYGEEEYLIAKEAEAKLEIKRASGLLADAYARNRNYEKAYFYKNIYAEVSDSLYNEDKKEEIGRLAGKYEVEIQLAEQKRLDEIKTQQEEQARERRNTIQYSSILVGLIVLFILLIVFRLFKVSLRILSAIAFFLTLILFEFVLVITDPLIDGISGGEPLYKLLINAFMALIIIPIHNVIEKQMKKTFLQRQKAGISED